MTEEKNTWEEPHVLINRYLQSRGIQRVWLARAIGVQPTFLQRMLTNMCPIPSKHWAAIVSNVDVPELLEAFVIDNMKRKGIRWVGGKRSKSNWECDEVAPAWQKYLPQKEGSMK